MWYHTDVNDRILEDRPVPFTRRGPSPEEQERAARATTNNVSTEHSNSSQVNGRSCFDLGSLQTAAVMAALSGRINFFQADSIPNK